MRFLIIIFSLLLFFFSCKKSEDSVSPAQTNTYVQTYDTIYPRPYYPIYPGSFWKYKVNDTSEEIIRSNPTYEQSLKYGYSSYASILNGEPVYGYNHPHLYPPYITHYFTVPFLSETVGDSFRQSYQDGRYAQTEYDSIFVIEKTKKGADSVITTKRKYITINEYGPPSTPIETLYYTEYTKNIGITKYCAIDGATLDTTYKKVLIDYFINR